MYFRSPGSRYIYLSCRDRAGSGHKCEWQGGEDLPAMCCKLRRHCRGTAPRLVTFLLQARSCLCGPHEHLLACNVGRTRWKKLNLVGLDGMLVLQADMRGSGPSFLLLFVYIVCHVDMFVCCLFARMCWEKVGCSRGRRLRLEKGAKCSWCEHCLFQKHATCGLCKGLSLTGVHILSAFKQRVWVDKGFTTGRGRVSWTLRGLPLEWTRT